MVTPAISTLANPAERLAAARIDYGEDRDYFKFVVPPGTNRWVRIWSSGNTDNYGILYDRDEVELERHEYFGANFHIDRVLEPGVHRLVVLSGGGTGPYGLHVAIADDHGNLFQTASRVELHSETPGSVDYSGDADFFWFQVSSGGSVEISSSGSTDTEGILYDSYEVELERHEYFGVNFRIERTLDPGTYYVGVQGGTGPYTLHLSGEASGVVSVPLVPSDDHPRGQQGFVRIINHSAEEADVEITAIDDTGREAGNFTLERLEPWKTMHFNSRDLELGNPAKGINNGVGSGTGDWYLEVAPSEPEVEVLSYIRTSDGFLTSMHGQAPSYGREHRVAVFNPGSNRGQASRLRLIHPKCPQSEQDLSCDPVNVTVFGVDDHGTRSPDIEFQLGSGAACQVTAAQLEGLDGGAGCLEDTPSDANRLHDGAGKWQLFVSADQPVHVMSLLESATGHLTNLSATTSSQIFSAPDSQQAD